MSNRVVVICCVGLTPSLIGEHTPHLKSLATRGFISPMEPVCPAVTTTAQTSMLTGVLPRQHGIVANGWYFRELAEVWLWRQSQALVEHPHVWQQLRRQGNDISVLKHFWWYAMNTDADITLTPRPAYHADGAKSPDFYAFPPHIKNDVIAAHGEFPLFNFWGPIADIRSSRWIADSFCTVWQTYPSDLAFCYLPHLDYDFQRFGPSGEHVARNLQELDDCVGTVMHCALEQEAEILVVSEYGIEACDTGVPINKELRQAGLLQVCTNATGELLDPGMSKAFAVADHQIAHVYCKDADAMKLARTLLETVNGIERIYSGDERSAIGLDHPRSGELIAIAEAGCWFQYEYWLNDLLRPDFANSIEIHKKPGYDPRELFFDPAGGKGRAMKALLRKKLGLRYVMNPVSLDPTLVKGSHGRAPSKPEAGPVLICSNPHLEQEHWHQCDIAGLIPQLLNA